MRFKQALSRKLAAALSAVMILSTIAPTSVPVLAAAPDDILTDSAVESVVQETGSDEILSESVETDEAAPEAAEDELSGETAEEVVDLDAEDIAAGDTGLEPDAAAPVEGDAAEAPEGEVAETPEGAEGDVTLTIAKGSTFSSISFAYIPRGGGEEVGYRLYTSETADTSVTLHVDEGEYAKIVAVYEEDDTEITSHYLAVNPIQIGETRYDDSYEYDTDIKGMSLAEPSYTFASVVPTEWSVSVEGGASYYNGIKAHYKTEDMSSEATVYFDSDGKAYADSSLEPIWAVVGSPVTFRIDNVKIYNSSSSSYAYYEGAYVDDYGDIGWAVRDGLYDATAGEFVTGTTIYDKGQETGVSYTLTAGNEYTAKYHKVLVSYATSSGTVSDGCIFEIESDLPEAKPTITGFDGLFGHGSESYNDKPAYVADFTDSYSTIYLSTYATATECYEVESASIIGSGQRIIGKPYNYSSGYSSIEFNVSDNLRGLLENHKPGQKYKLNLSLVKKSVPYAVTLSNNSKGYSDWTGLESVTDLNGFAEGSSGYYDVEPGKSPKFYITIKDNYALKGAKFNGTALTEKDLKNIVTTKGYEVKIEKDSVLDIETEALKTVKVKDFDGNDYPKTKKGYDVKPYNKKAYIYYLEGSEKQILSANSATDSKGKDVTADTLKQLNEYTVVFDGTKVPGQTVTVKVKAAGLDEKDAELKFVVAKSGTFKISKNTDTMPVGGTRTYKTTPKNIKWTLSDNILDEKGKTLVPLGGHFDVDWDSVEGQKELKITSNCLNKDEIGKTYDIYILDAEDDSVLETLKVTLEDTTVKGAAAPGIAVKTTDINSLYLDLSNSVKDMPIKGLYYAVTATDKAGAANKNTKFVDEITRYYKVDGKKQTVYFSLLKPDKDTAANERATDLTRKYTLSVRLIQYNSDVDVLNSEADVFAKWWIGPKYDAADLVIEGTNKTDLSKEVTMPETDKYASKLKLKKVKGKSGAVYTNTPWELAYELDIDYGKNTTVKKITKVRLLDKKGNVIESEKLGWRDNNDKYIAYKNGAFLRITDEKIQFAPQSELPAGKYTIEAYAFEPLGVEVVGKAKVTVKDAFTELNMYTDANPYSKKPGKVLKFNVNASGYSFTKDKWSLTKKVVWKISEWKQTIDFNPTTRKYELVDDDPYVAAMSDDLLAIKDKISIKGGKVTIKDKNFVAEKEGKWETWLYVYAQANDWKGSPEWDGIKIYITNDNQNQLKAYNYFDGRNIKDNASYTVSEFFNDNGVSTKNGRYRTTLNFRDEAGNYVSVKWKASGAAKYDKKLGSLVFKKPGTVKISGTALDGSGRKFGPIKINIKAADGDIKYDLLGWRKAGEYTTISSNIEGKTGDGINYAPSTTSMRLDVQGLLSDNTISYMPAKVSATGAKVKAIKNCPGLYYITPNSSETGIKITAGSKKVEFKVKNASIGKDKTKITASNVYKVNGKDNKGKVFGHLDYSYNTDMFTAYNKVSVNKVEYSITGAAASTNNVMVSVVYPNKKWNSAQKIRNAIADNDGVLDRNTHLLIPVKDSKFSIDYAEKWNEGKKADLSVDPGTYTLIVTPVLCDDLGNIIEATGKTVKLKVKFTKAPKAKVKIGTKFNFADGTKDGTVSKNGAVSQDIVLNVKNKNYMGDTSNIFFNLYHTRGFNKKGKINNFGKNFGVTYDEKEKKYQLGYGSSDYFNEDGTTIDPSKNKADKDELKGYIPVTYQQLNGEVVTEFVKVSIKLNKGAALTK